MSERTIIVTVEATKVIKPSPSCFELDKEQMEKLLIMSISEVLGRIDDIHIKIQDFPIEQTVMPAEFTEQTMSRFERVE